MKLLSSLSLLGIVNSSTTSSQPQDPCVALCEEFSAARRGNGFDLCDDPRLSRCELHPNNVIQICTNLYWSFSPENGVAGFLYAVDQTELTPQEIATPISCDEAVQVLQGQFNDDDMRIRIRIFTSALQIFMHLRPVTALISSTDSPSGPFVNHLREIQAHLQSHDNSMTEIIPLLNDMEELEMNGPPEYVEQMLDVFARAAGPIANMGDESDVVVFPTNLSGQEIQEMMQNSFGDRELVAFVDSDHEAWIKIDSQWHKTHNNGLIRIVDPVSAISRIQITATVYQRI